MKTLAVKFPGEILKPGFWLYVWRVKTPKGLWLYVGRTGDSSSAKAAPPYRRMGQHLGMTKASNALRTYLLKKKIDPERCSFDFIAHGPIFKQQMDMKSHKPYRDRVAIVEKDLAEALGAVGYNVFNSVHCRMLPDPKLWASVRRAFSSEFPKLKNFKPSVLRKAISRA